MSATNNSSFFMYERLKFGLSCFSFAQVDEDDSCKDKHCRKAYNPAECPTPPDTIDVEKEVRKPLVASDKVASIDEGNI